ncbi:MAG: thermonuclease family protein [Erythrobacter sp.]|nr:thermonuclease family protein [Erythrobacter sp.]NCQ62422.1 thermonuclease family protein [Alphaproteobacteria bacterium]
MAVDGDTLRCQNLLEEANGRVRLARIDSPERGDPGHHEATAYLSSLITGKEVRCQLVDADPRVPGFERRDRYGRPVARCFADGQDLQQALLERGFAKPWP